MTAQLPSRERIAELVAFKPTGANTIQSATREEWQAMARALLAAHEQEPVAWLLSGGGAKNIVSFDSGNAYADPLREVTPLFIHPSAVANSEQEPVYQIEHDDGTWSDVEEDEFLRWHSIGDGVRVLYTRPAPSMKPVGYLFISDEGAVMYSPNNWGMTGFKCAGQVFGKIDDMPAPSIPAAVPEGISQWIDDVVEYLNGGLEADGELEAEGSIEAKRLLARHAALLNGVKS